MPRDQKTLLLSQAAKNPELQKLVDSANDMSLEDISKLNIAKWMRDALTRIKQEAHYKDFQAFVLSNVIEPFGEDFTGNVVRWAGGETFMPFGRSELLVNENDLLFVTDKGIWLDTAFTDKPDPKLAACVPVKSCKFTEYRLEVRKMLNEKHSGIVKTAEQEEARKDKFTVKRWSGEYPPGHEPKYD